jgi:uncharacterized damage-inducible protein DinB
MSAAGSDPASGDPRYPIGQFQPPPAYTQEFRVACMAEIASVPAALRAAVDGLTDEQLDTPYREGGWTVRQLVHHVADSHMNSYIRTKFAMSEEQPAVKGYDENIWAAFPDASEAAVELSLALIENLHARWAYFWRSLKTEDFARVMVHSQNGPMTLDFTLALYTWHGKHHVAHVTALRQRMGW